ncbi:MAG: response regulator transcription factor [Myxococcales bacterium]|nr:response regulator transcription factor [Myxococcales bacterium]
MAGGFLIIEDEPGLARSLARQLIRHRPVSVVHSLAEARDKLRSKPEWTGVVLDLVLPDGHGLDLLAEIRENHRGCLPVLVLTGELNREIVNRVQSLRAEYVCKPASADNLLPFIERSLAQERVGNEAVGASVTSIAARFKLTRRETELLSLAVDGLSRRELAEALGVRENTVKAQVRSILKKSGARSIATLAQDVLKGSVREDDETTEAEPREAQA